MNLESAFNSAFVGSQRTSSKKYASISFNYENTSISAFGAPDPASQPNLQAGQSVFVEEDKLEQAARLNPLVTKYASGRVISFFSLSIVICCVALIGLTIASLVMYRPVTNDMKDEYVEVSAGLTYKEQFENFLGVARNARVLVESEVDYQTIFSEYPQLVSITRVADSSKSDFQRVSRKFNSTSIMVIDHSADCVFSLTSVCDPNYINNDIRTSPWYVLGSGLIGSSNLTWDGPYAVVNPLTNQVANTISLIWKSTNSSSQAISVSNMVINMGYFELAQNPLLDNNGTERVWILNSANETVVSALGVDLNSYLTISVTTSGTVSVSLLPVINVTRSLTDGEWLSDLISMPSWFTTPSWSSTRLAGDVSAAVSTVNSAPIFSIIVASNSVPFYDSTFVSLVIAEIVVAVIPLIATLLVLSGYWLRIAAIKRTKQRRKIELLDAQNSLETTRSAKVNPSIIELTKVERRSLADLRRDAGNLRQSSNIATNN
jgi:hypothetical protein